MGHTLTIGEAVPCIPTDLDSNNTPGWTVHELYHEDAPQLPNDGFGRCSSRSPGYKAWADFCGAVGLDELFYGASKGGKYNRDVCLLSAHPGVALLRPADLLEIRYVRIQWEAHKWPVSERIAGWDGREMGAEPDPRYDPHMGRLIWLEWWVAYALENCKLPAMSNA